MRTTRLPPVDWTDAPTDLKGLVRFAERRNLVSACAPSHLNWPLPLYFWTASYRQLPSYAIKKITFFDYENMKHIIRPIIRGKSTKYLTLLWYHEKSYVNSTMGSIWSHCKKKQNINTVYYNVLFPPNNNNIAQVCTQISTNRHDFVLGTFEYTEADTHTAFSAFCRQLSILHGRYNGGPFVSKRK